MSVRILSEVWKSSRCRGGELLMLLAIADFADDEGIAYPSIATLSAKARLSTRQAQRTLKTLIKHRELDLEPGKGPRGTYRYHVLCLQGDILTGGADKMSEGDNLSGVTQTTLGGDILGQSGPSSMSPGLTLNPSEETVREPGDLAQRDRRPSRKSSRVQLADPEFIAELKQNPGYEGIDIDGLVHRLKAWQLTPKGKGKMITRQRLLNCLNREERRPMVLPEKRTCEWRSGLRPRCTQDAVANSRYCQMHRDAIRDVQEAHGIEVRS